METTTMMIYILEMLVMVLGVLFIKPEIMKSIYGKRYKHYIEIDTGRHGYCVLSKDNKNVKITGTTRAVNYRNIEHDTLYFYSGLAENVKTEYDNEKALFYMNSNEYDTLFNNNVYQKLMITKAENLISIITLIVVITLVVTVYTAYNSMSVNPALNELYNQSIYIRDNI